MRLAATEAAAASLPFSYQFFNGFIFKSIFQVQSCPSGLCRDPIRSGHDAIQSSFTFFVDRKRLRQHPLSSQVPVWIKNEKKKMVFLFSSVFRACKEAMLHTGTRCKVIQFTNNRWKAFLFKVEDAKVLGKKENIYLFQIWWPMEVP